MRSQKNGFIGFGVMLAILFGFLVIGSGAYYMTKQKPVSMDAGKTPDATSTALTSSSTTDMGRVVPTPPVMRPLSPIDGGNSQSLSPRVPTSEDTISVVYPNGGESFAIGDTILLRSSSGKASTIEDAGNGYYLVDAQGIAREIGHASDSFSWKTTSYWNGEAVIPGTYKLRVIAPFGPCPGATCVQDESDHTFTITQGSKVSSSGVLRGKVTLPAGITPYQAMLSINTRQERPDSTKGTSYTLINVGILEPKDDGTFEMNLVPGTYRVELVNPSLPAGYSSVTGLPTTVNIKSGVVTTLNFSFTERPDGAPPQR